MKWLVEQSEAYALSAHSGSSSLAVIALDYEAEAYLTIACHSWRLQSGVYSDTWRSEFERPLDGLDGRNAPAGSGHRVDRDMECTAAHA